MKIAADRWDEVARDRRKCNKMEETFTDLCSL